jgi:hypothetical protein
MPYGDGTGPRGMGPMTGRGAGYCTGFAQTRFPGRAFGRGWFSFNRGAGRGRGRGMMRPSPAPSLFYSRW